MRRLCKHGNSKQYVIPTKLHPLHISKMIFQYTRVFSETDFKRHYRWECISREYEHMFIFLSPNGNRLSTVFDNSVQHTGVTSRLFTFANKFLNPSDLDTYNKLIIDCPMIPYVEVCELHKDDGATEYEHALRDNVGSRTPMILVLDCHLSILNIETRLLQLDEDNKTKQQMSAFWNELTNVLAKVDSTSFLSNCLQQLNVAEKKEISTLTQAPQPSKEKVKRTNRSFDPDGLTVTGLKRAKRDCKDDTNSMQFSQLV